MKPLILAVAAAAAVATASQAAAPAIAVSDAWARPTPPGATTGAVYATLTNRQPIADALLSATSPEAAKVEFHSMTMTGGVMHMNAVTGPQKLQPGVALRFDPGAAHIMLVGLKAPLKLGGHVTVVLRFARAGVITVEAPVSNAAPDGMAGMKM
ncbi:copper chaperone PCu(A)C [Caulobacter sp. KR2-114]|uniref:copper chaperone PCu(A)C n=1 Tax=Caulobacter sp. KR2-114 TaxID=3400912 RepID=UPI003C0598F7